MNSTHTATHWVGAIAAKSLNRLGKQVPISQANHLLQIRSQISHAKQAGTFGDPCYVHAMLAVGVHVPLLAQRHRPMQEFSEVVSNPEHV